MSLGAFNQVSWYGVGDVDECWIIATYWALVASGVMRRKDLPTIREFREAAGNPDRPGSTGGNNRQLMLALKTLVPNARTEYFVGGAGAFTRALQNGYVASLSLLSRYLPSYARFGFMGAHQVSVYYQGGKYYIMNPLAREGSALLPVSLATLQRASGALFGDTLLHAVFVKPKPSSKKKESPGFFPQMPRDLNAPIIVRNYLDPFAPAKLYRSRHPKR